MQRFYSLRIYLAGEFGLYQLKGCKFRLVISNGYHAQANKFYSRNAQFRQFYKRISKGAVQNMHRDAKNTIFFSIIRHVLSRYVNY